MTWVVALILTAVALPSLAARALGGRPPEPGPRLAALAPVAVLPAVAAVGVAAAAAWWLAVALAIPAAFAVAWQLPAPRARPQPSSSPLPDRGTVALRVLTMNVQSNYGDPVTVVAAVRRAAADVLAVQELTPDMMAGLAQAGLRSLLPFSHVNGRPGSSGTGIWARWPLVPLPPVTGLRYATPRARINPPGSFPVTVTAVHPVAPVRGKARLWQRELGLLRSALAGTAGPQVVAGDFNASRDHQPFRALLAVGFTECADAARRRPWPGFTWPVKLYRRRFVPLMRLDHVLLSQGAGVVREAALTRIPGSDHCGVLAVIDLPSAGDSL